MAGILHRDNNELLGAYDQVGTLNAIISMNFASLNIVKGSI